MQNLHRGDAAPGERGSCSNGMPRATNGGAGGREAGDGDHPEAAGTTVATTAHCALCFDTLLAVGVAGPAAPARDTLGA